MRERERGQLDSPNTTNRVVLVENGRVCPAPDATGTLKPKRDDNNRPLQVALLGGAGHNNLGL